MSLDHPEFETARRLLVELGLTGTEAEVYCAALQLGAAEPLSSYRLAQAMGRDPANVGKTLAALVRAQAVHVVQDKPRLYLPTPPDAFASRVRDRVSRHGREAVAVLERLQGGEPGPTGYVQTLAGADAVFGQARRMLEQAAAAVLAWGSKEWLREVGADLEAAAEHGGCRVRILSPVAMVTEHAEIAVAPRKLVPPPGEHLQLVIDGAAWLCAGRGAVGPAGCWAAGGPVGGILSAQLAAFFPGVDDMAAPVADGAPAATEPAPEPHPEPEPAPAPEPAPEPAGLTFLVRHDRTKEKGEP